MLARTLGTFGLVEPFGQLVVEAFQLFGQEQDGLAFLRIAHGQVEQLVVNALLKCETIAERRREEHLSTVTPVGGKERDRVENGEWSLTLGNA